MNRDELIEAAAEAMFELEYPRYIETAVADHNRWSWRGDGHGEEMKERDYRVPAGRAIDAVLPLIEADVRDGIAAEIEVQGRGVVEWLAAHTTDEADRRRLVATEDSYRDCIRIVRNEKVSIEELIAGADQ